MEPNLKKKIDQKREIKEALSFFSRNTAHIEIVREDSLARVYFPKLPMANSLPRNIKNEFHLKVDRSSTKTKLKDLMLWSNEFIKIMKHEERLKQTFKKNHFVGKKNIDIQNICLKTLSKHKLT